MSTHNGVPAGVSDREAARQLDGDIAKTREELSALVGELDRRRHETLDIRKQLRTHARAVAITGAAVVAVTAAITWYSVARRRSYRRSWTDALNDLAARAGHRWERRPAVPAQSSMAERVLVAAATAVSVTAGRALAGWAIKQFLEREWDGATTDGRPQGPDPSALSRLLRYRPPIAR